ncbi:diguanylate cyclase domain-containing protein [Clostridium neuense]|uniref:Diguanylate cyclase domain-containing protein n=1 Tax=Clostridium neuense TaxID=1728934 RepID=A0ABW8TDM3_9CLOT
MNNKNKLVLKVFAIFALTALFIAASWRFVKYEIDNHKENTINSFLDEQYLENSKLAAELQINLEDNVSYKRLTSDLSEKAVIKDIIKKETNSKNRYIFFYDDNGVLFEKNDEATKKYNGKDIKKLFKDWEYNGANASYNSGVKGLILNGENGTGELVKDSRRNYEVVSWCFFTANGKRYLIGISTLEDYLMNKTMFNQHALRIYSMCGIFTIVFLIISIAFSIELLFSFRKSNVLQREAINKNVQIQEFVQRVDTLTRTAKMACIYDSLTKVYNREFFYTVLRKLDEELFLPITIIVARIDNLNEDVEYKKYDEMLVDIAKIFKEYCKTPNLISRVDEDEFAMIFINTDESTVKNILNTIEDEIGNSYISDLCEIHFKTFAKVSEKHNLVNILKSIRRDKFEV